MTAEFRKGLSANRPHSKGFAGEAQMSEVLCGVLTAVLWTVCFYCETGFDFFWKLLTKIKIIDKTIYKLLDKKENFMYNKIINFYNFLKKYYRRIKKLKLSLRQVITFRCNFKWFGNEYGGFFICPDILRNDEIIVYSAGVGEDISFDMDIINEYGNCNVFAFDPTPKSINWIKKQNLPENYKFYPYGISSKTGKEQMFLPKNKDHVSGSVHKSEHLSKDNMIVVEMKCIEDIIQNNNHQYVDIIKMDIEGSEFSVLENLNFEKIMCGQMVIEFHERFFKNGKKLLDKSIKKLKDNNYYCFAISNSGEEYSFINKNIYSKI